MQFKIIFLGFGLIIPYFQPTNVVARQTEVPFLAPISAKVMSIEMPALEQVSKLEMVAFRFSPPGSYVNPYPAGQCTWLVASMKGNVPAWGNANRWDDNALASGLTVSTEPIVGAVAQTDRGAYGHVAVVTAVVPGGVVITEGNYDYQGSVRTRPAATSEFVYIYL